MTFSDVVLLRISWKRECNTTRVYDRFYNNTLFFVHYEKCIDLELSILRDDVHRINFVWNTCTRLYIHVHSSVSVQDVQTSRCLTATILFFNYDYIILIIILFCICQYIRIDIARTIPIDICNFSTRINLNSCDNYFTFFAGYAYVHMYTCILDAKPLKLWRVNGR